MPIIKNLNADDLEKLADFVKEYKYKYGDIILDKDGVADCQFFMVVEGECAAMRTLEG